MEYTRSGSAAGAAYQYHLHTRSSHIPGRMGWSVCNITPVLSIAFSSTRLSRSLPVSDLKQEEPGWLLMYEFLPVPLNTCGIAWVQSSCH